MTPAILFEDNHLLIANKPPGCLTQPDATGNNSLQIQLQHYLKEKYHKAGNVFLEPIHRLDKPVSGIAVFARTSKALSRLQVQMKAQSIGRYYIAWVMGALARPAGQLKHYLLHGDHRAFIASSNIPSAKEALLSYYTLLTEGLWSLVEVKLHTGRYHQIRAQLAACGCPILGDKRYGSAIDAYTPQGIALHHIWGQFQHPITKVTLAVTAPLPEKWPLLDRCTPFTNRYLCSGIN